MTTANSYPAPRTSAQRRAIRREADRLRYVEFDEQAADALEHGMHGTAEQWELARYNAARRYWQDPARHEFARQIEAEWHDAKPLVERELSAITGQPLRIPPMPPDPPPSLWSRLSGFLRRLV